MPRKKAPPIGILPRELWKEQFPNPTWLQLQARGAAVLGAIHRYIDAGLPPRKEWILELFNSAYHTGRLRGFTEGSSRCPEPSVN